MSEGTSKGNDNGKGVSSEESQAHSSPCSREELTELVRAIKFAKPDASIRAVHHEISEELSQNESFQFLKDIKLNDVKRVWKKAVASSGPDEQQQTASSAADTAGLPDTDVWKLYTVGDGAIKTLAYEYSQAAAAAAAAAAVKEEQEKDSMMKNYVHFFLDVPADRSGLRPHQALINFHENSAPTNTGKGKAKSEDKSRGEIVKIQMAASMGGTKYPMLLYNANRSRKTFIHPDPKDKGYQCIQEWISKDGVGGALGNAGGSKAYFYSRITERKNAADVISIDVSGTAPPQPW